MKITTFNPQIVTRNAEAVAKLFEELGFERRHTQKNAGENNITIIRMKDANGFYVDISESQIGPPQDMVGIRMNVDNFEQARDILLSKGFKSVYGNDSLNLKSSRSAMMISPSGYGINVIEHIKSKPAEETTGGLIPSFSVDHTKIIPGIFVSRQDTIKGAVITTYDIRVTKPNDEPAIDVAAMHTLEHVIATYLRNDAQWKDEVIYWGPMGCLTGFYLILKGERAPKQIHELLLAAFSAVADAKEVPGATAKNCGNYLMHNLPMAKWYAAKFAKYLADNADNEDIFVYPRTERLVTEDGQDFYDS